MAAVERHIQYKRALGAGDAVTIQSALLEVKDKSIHMLHKMVHDASGEVAAVTVVVGVHIDANIRKAVRLPEDVRRRAIEMKEHEMAALQETCAKKEERSPGDRFSTFNRVHADMARQKLAKVNRRDAFNCVPAIISFLFFALIGS